MAQTSDMAERWMPFVYGTMYDRPRVIFVALAGATLFLLSEFDDELDDYEVDYRCYLLPAGIDLTGSCVDLVRRALRLIGRVSVMSVRFDGTRRSSLELGSLGPTVCEALTPFLRSRDAAP